jgi:uncharacterized protein with ATP-grasp and redox domains
MCNNIVEAADQFMLPSSEYYKPLKLKSNRHAKELLPPARDFIDQGETDQEKFIRACCLAAASNIAPIGGLSETLKFQEVKDILIGKSPWPVVKGDVFETVKKAKQVLYVTDNAGEIGFDSLLISRLKDMGSNIALLVREDPFFEDATTEDASFFHLDRWVDDLLTVKGLFVPPRNPSPLRDSLDKSDLIISKGTGNFEALRGEVSGKPVIFMLKVKCKPVAEITKMAIGSFTVQIDA